MEYSIWQWIGMATISGVTCLAALKWYFDGSLRRGPAPWEPAGAQDCVYWFEDGVLLSGPKHSDGLFPGASDVFDWTTLRGMLGERFPGFPLDQLDIAPHGTTVVHPGNPADDARILIDPLGARTRVELVSDIGWTPDSRSVDTEQATLRAIAQHMPHPAWTLTSDGIADWHNAAYARLYHACHGQDPQPDKPLFVTNQGTHRLPLARQAHDHPNWYDVTTVRDHDGVLCFATDVSDLVSAQTSQRNFVQTLSKTFAQLSTGLAIFDREMQLVLFNPALIDLTGLQAEFLSARPTLLSFFDHLRDGQIMPEPKSYATWREELTDMIAAASDGNYRDTWTLPSGLTYEVTGRPHPDGAVAFLFKDISAEITLTRRFRSDLELNQSILDELDDAIAIFSTSGAFTMSNAAYRDLWQTDHEAGFEETTILDAMKHWQNIAGPNRLWGEVRDFILGQEDRVSWTTSITFQNGSRFMCFVSPLPNGTTMVRMSKRGRHSGDNADPFNLAT